MELFIWLWAYDKRLLCGSLSESKNTFFDIYIWLLPCIIAASALIFTYFAKVTSTNWLDLSTCFAADEEIAESGENVLQLIYLQ